MIEYTVLYAGCAKISSLIIFEMMLQGALFSLILFSPLIDSDQFVNFDLLIVFNPILIHQLFRFLDLSTQFNTIQILNNWIHSKQILSSLKVRSK